MRIIYWFKRDLRIKDNRSLIKAIKDSKELIPIFIFDKDLLDEFKAYDKRTGFIIDNLERLSDEIKIYCFYDKTEDIFRMLLEKLKPDAVYTQKAYTWSGEERNSKIENICKNYKVKFMAIDDGMLADIKKIPYKKVFNAFYNQWIKNIDNEITKKIPESKIPIFKLSEIKDIKKIIKYEENKYFKKTPFEILKEYNFKEYENMRNLFYLEGTTRLSPHIRFGTISIREIFNESIKSEVFIKELAWREFWYHIKENFKDFKNLEFQEKRRGIRWENRDEYIKAFEEARTGYPIIDAAIIQLKEENWMHNRLRMVVANFLTKDLFIDWRIGERFFKRYLIDYDEVVNTGNWQWCASVGPDPKPFRIFNPMIQSKKFDPECLFIKKYLPELKKIPSEELHNPIKYNIKYHKPIVNHYEAIKKAKSLYYLLISS